MNKSKLSFQYSGSKFWVIFWAIVFFPIALVLLATGATFHGGGKSYRILYAGSRFWLGFWTLACFPIAFILMLVNGISLETEDFALNAA